MTMTREQRAEARALRPWLARVSRDPPLMQRMTIARALRDDERAAAGPFSLAEVAQLAGATVLQATDDRRRGILTDGPKFTRDQAMAYVAQVEGRRRTA